MKIDLSKKRIFPEEVERLLAAIYSSGFFSQGLVGGSWTFPVYSEILDAKYILKTFDIDLVVDAISSRE